ncbi:hypothetical protein [Ensifer soli]|uniref:hypothetical protein n=1 Tax=Ciceribacter sp. sgz301302 TaxID=3342379 RepID=UPI0035BA1A5B
MARRISKADWLRMLAQFIQVRKNGDTNDIAIETTIRKMTIPLPGRLTMDERRRDFAGA